jgi:hypothetical protein
LCGDQFLGSTDLAETRLKKSGSPNELQIIGSCLKAEIAHGQLDSGKIDFNDERINDCSVIIPPVNS